MFVTSVSVFASRTLFRKPGGPFVEAPDARQMLLAHHNLGGSGPILLMLHANSLCGLAYTPLVSMVISKHFRCIALDAPGQGDSPCLPDGTQITLEVLVDCIYTTIRHLGLLGCRVFGHSMGGCLALSVECAHPGTFSAMYVYEAPCATSTGLQRDRSMQASMPPGTPTPGQELARLARRRRWHWPTRPAALQALSAKPPFSLWHPDAMQAFLAHGIRAASNHASTKIQQLASNEANRQAKASVGGGAGESSGVVAGVGQSFSNGPVSLSPGHDMGVFDTNVDTESSTAGYNGPVQLCCSPTTEEAVYVAFEPPPSVGGARIRCPVAWGVAAEKPGLHSRLPQLGRAALNDLPCMELHQFPHLSHFGPLEAPEHVARDVVEFFQRVDAGAVVQSNPDPNSLPNRLVLDAKPAGGLPPMARL